MEQVRGATLRLGATKTNSDLQSITNGKLTRGIDMRIAHIQHSAICNRRSVFDAFQSANRTCNLRSKWGSCSEEKDHVDIARYRAVRRPQSIANALRTVPTTHLVHATFFGSPFLVASINQLIDSCVTSTVDS